LQRINLRALSAWILPLSLVLYLAIDGGGYALAVHCQIGIAVWWVVVVGAAWRLLPVARFSRTALGIVGSFAAFTIWTALGVIWSISSERSFQDIALVTCYLGIFVLAVSIHRDRNEGVRYTTAAVATAIVIVAALAVASRLWPHVFPAAQQTGQFLRSDRARLSWPLNYWNALAALMAIGIPLLLAEATSARTLTMQAAAAASIPLVVLCEVLTLSRGGVIEGVIAVIVFLALAHDRIQKLATGLLAAAGSAVVVYGGLHRPAIQHGLVSRGESHQAVTLLVAVVLTCAGVGIAQMGVGLSWRHGTLPSVLRVPRARSRSLSVAAFVLLVIAALAAGAPRHLRHTWDDFKKPTSAVSQTSTSRLGSSSGEGRYQYWQAAVESAKPHVLTGSGPGTFQLDWLPRAPFESYVENAHSLYVETYAELGLFGLALLVGFLVAALVAVVRLAVQRGYEDRTRAAATVATLVAFLVGAAFDWLWQMPVIPAVILLLLGAALAPEQGHLESRRRPRLLAQITMVVGGLACLAAIVYPLAAATVLASSQTAASTGNLRLALADAQDAVRIEPGAASALVQLALVYESYHTYPRAVTAARHAVRDEPANWSNWLILSRLDAEDRDPQGALTAYRKAKSLNPQSRLFRTP
jgi:hypothetical protein